MRETRFHFLLSLVTTTVIVGLGRILFAQGVGDSDAISRAFTVVNQLPPPPPQAEAISRAFTLINLLPEPPALMEAISRAFTIDNQLPPSPSQFETISRAFTIDNRLPPPSPPVEAISRAFTVNNLLPEPPALKEVISRAFTVENTGPPPKCRFISLPPMGAPGTQSAIRVKLMSLHHVVPPYTGGASVPFESFEGQVRWVGPPAQYLESTSTGIPFYASSLRCTAYYQDWSTVGILHVTGSAIVPSSLYEVSNLAGSCIGMEANCTDISAPLSINTTRWGDVEVPYNPPSPTTQPDLGDVAALVDKFKSTPGAPIKARALLAGDDVFGNINTLNLDMGFGHIAACLDAFKGKPYPHTIAACP